MAVEVARSIDYKSNLLDQRFLLGIFVPVYFEMILLYIIYFKAFPVNFQHLSFISLVSIGISLVYNLATPYLCWYFSRASLIYKNYLQKHFVEIFILPVKGKISGKKALEYYSNQFKREVPNIIKYARNDYIKNFYQPSIRFSNHELEGLESKFLFLLNLTIFGISNHIIIRYLQYSDISLFFLNRDTIISREIYIILIINIVIVIALLIIIIQTSDNLVFRILESNTSPYVESKQDRDVRESYSSAISSMTELEIPFDNKLHLTQITEYIMQEEFKWLLKQNLKEKLFNSYVDQWREELELDPIEVEELSRLLSMNYIFPTESSLDYKDIDLILRSIHNEVKQFETMQIKSSFTIIRGVILNLVILIEYVNQKLLPNERNNLRAYRRLYELKFINEEEFGYMNEFRRLRNENIHRFTKIDVDRFYKLFDIIIDITTKLHNRTKGIQVRAHKRVKKDKEGNLYVVNVKSYFKKSK